VVAKVMLIKTLVENTSISKDFGSEHGLSLYVETKKHKILFDVGASDLLIMYN
jgi:7,8-dihydropterin-6-yl-methyl-4-(beta-D-ribofuranosyl)aminobenzene 5'-phosphate synthase